MCPKPSSRRTRRSLTLAAAVLAGLLAACGPKKAAPAPSTRPFPQVDIPGLYTEQAERVDYFATHFWDRFTDTLRCYPCDSTRLNGVALPDVEQAMGLFATVALELPPDRGAAAMARFCDRLEAFARKYPESGVFEGVIKLTERYFYDPQSPVRGEDLYQVVAARLAVSDRIPEAERGRYAFDARMAALNRVGTRAADFTFVDSRGRVRTLYGVEAEHLVLIFGNPDCAACRELMEAMEGSLPVTERIADGRLKVLDVYIDEDLDSWKAHLSEYPASWINGYDPALVIRADRIYNVRAIPSLYLLDRDKTVLLKDAPQERLLSYLFRL